LEVADQNRDVMRDQTVLGGYLAIMAWCNGIYLCMASPEGIQVNPAANKDVNTVEGYNGRIIEKDLRSVVCQVYTHQE